jgi:molybdate transport system ATP-binding protein
LIDAARAFPGGPSLRFQLTLPPSGTTVLFGPSGSGKTTLLRMLAGLERPDQGRVGFGEETWFDTDRRINLPPHERRVGYVTQESALFPHMTVRRNVAFGVPSSEQVRVVPDVLALVGVSDLADRLPGELSGGQKQRVALARAIASKPRILLLDEPLSALDATARDALRRDLGRFLRSVGIPAVLVTHDRAEALALGDEVVLIDNGRVLQQGPIADVFSRPSSVDAARVVGVEAVVPARITSRSNEGLVTLDAMGTTLTALDPGPDIDLVFACIRADEVIVESGQGPTSARNRLPATIRAIHTEGPLVRLELDCGFALAAYITRVSLREMKLETGSVVNAVIKAPAVHLVPRDQMARP